MSTTIPSNFICFMKLTTHIIIFMSQDETTKPKIGCILTEAGINDIIIAERIDTVLKSFNKHLTIKNKVRIRAVVKNASLKDPWRFKEYVINAFPRNSISSIKLLIKQYTTQRIAIDNTLHKLKAPKNILSSKQVCEYIPMRVSNYDVNDIIQALKQ